jgi:hypothetical protein
VTTWSKPSWKPRTRSDALDLNLSKVNEVTFVVQAELEIGKLQAPAQPRMPLAVTSEGTVS